MNLIFKTEFLTGAKGDAGDGLNFEVPTGAVIAYDGEGIPNGYIETTPPDGMGSSFSPSIIRNIIEGTTTITAQGEVTT